MGEINISPAFEFERLVCNDYDKFVYTAENMSKLKDMRDDLKIQVENAKQQAAEKREELKALWSYLDEPKHLCESFLLNHQGHSVTTISAVSIQNNTIFLKMTYERTLLSLISFSLVEEKLVISLYIIVKHRNQTMQG